MTLFGLAVCGIVVFFVLLFLLWVFATMEPHPLEDFIRANPEPVPDTPVYPLPEDSPEPTWLDGYRSGLKAVEAPENFYWRSGCQSIEPDWQDDLRAYHSHLCPCPACADVEASRQSRIKSMLRKNSQW